jgi:hypothetical protein
MMLRQSAARGAMSSEQEQQRQTLTANPIVCPCVKHEIEGLGLLSEDRDR